MELCFNTIYFKYKDVFYEQNHGCAMASPVFPIVTNLYMEEVEKEGTEGLHWSPYHSLVQVQHMGEDQDQWNPPLH